MLKFAGALGLRGFERITGGGSEPAELRWCIPLPRGHAQWARDRIERTSGSYRAAAIESPPSGRARTSSRAGFGPSGEVDALFSDLVNGRIGYVAGGSYASLRRMLLINTRGASAEDVRRRAVRALEELGLGELAAEPTSDQIARHVRAVLLLRNFPELTGKVYLDAEVWPPDPVDLGKLEAHFGMRADAVAAVRVVNDRATAFALVRERSFGPISQVAALCSFDDDPAEVAAQCIGGPLAARWRLLAFGTPPEGLAEIEDLKGNAAAYVALKVLLQRRVGTFIAVPAEYVLLFNNTAFDRIERFALERDRIGNLGDLSEGISDGELGTAIGTQLLDDACEILFPDALPPALVLGVLCKSAAGLAALEEALAGGRVRVRAKIAERYELP